MAKARSVRSISGLTRETFAQRLMLFDRRMSDKTPPTSMSKRHSACPAAFRSAALLSCSRSVRQEQPARKQAAIGISHCGQQTITTEVTHPSEQGNSNLVVFHTVTYTPQAAGSMSCQLWSSIQQNPQGPMAASRTLLGAISISCWIRTINAVHVGPMAQELDGAL